MTDIGTEAAKAANEKNAEIIEDVITEPVDDDNKVKEPVEPVEDIKAPEDDMVTRAMKENEELKKQLEDFKKSSSNVFEQNEALKVELKNQEKLLKIAQENEELTQQLNGIKKKSLIDSLLARGSITNDLESWASNLDYESLQEFAKHAPKRKTILDQKNTDSTASQKAMEEWKKEQQKSRIL